MKVLEPGTIYRQVNIIINDGSDTALNINDYGVSGGMWNPEFTPQPGQLINPGDHPKFVNYTDKPYTSVAGYITLFPMSGGSIKSDWEWKYGSPFSFTNNTQNTKLSVKGQITGQTSTEVTLQIWITNS